MSEEAVMMKKVFILLFCLFFLCGCEKSSNDKKLIMTTNFPCYDFVRAIVGEDSSFEVKMLLSPGQEIHDFEPSPKDLGQVFDSSLFVYVGGESESWVSKVFNSTDFNQVNALRLLDLVDTLDEEVKEGMEEEEEEREVDEHVWTSPKRAITIIQKLKDKIISLDEENAEIYEENTAKYLAKIKDIDLEFQDIVSHSRNKKMVFGDRFPFLYFARDYGIDYYAAFPGCSSSTEVSAKTLKFLIQKVSEEHIPVVFHIEFSTHKIAETIAAETQAKVLEFHSGHTISLEEFKSNITYVDLMKRNVEALKEALL